MFAFQKFKREKTGTHPPTLPAKPTFFGKKLKTGDLKTILKTMLIVSRPIIGSPGGDIPFIMKEGMGIFCLWGKALNKGLCGRKKGFAFLFILG